AFELRAAPLDASSPSVRISAPPTLGPVVGDVEDFRISADGSLAVYRADVYEDEVMELVAVPAAPPAAPRRLDPLPSGQSVLDDYVLGAGGAYVAYQVALTASRHSVRVARTDGATPPLELVLEPFSASGFIGLTPDESRAVFLRKYAPIGAA